MKQRESKGWVDRKKVLLYAPTYVHSAVERYLRLTIFVFRLQINHVQEESNTCI
jgi:hypothetical protein